VFRGVALALCAVVGAAHGRSGSARALVDPLADSTARRIEQFLERWFQAWTASNYEVNDLRAYCRFGECERGKLSQNLHCHPEFVHLTIRQGEIGKQDRVYVEPERFIGSRFTAYAVCPSWLLTAGSLAGDERLTIDYALTAGHRDAIRRARDSLIGYLEGEQRVHPADSFVVGQLVRFAVDQRDFERGLRAASLCGAGQWWCAVLRAYVLHAAGKVASADSAFLQAGVFMPPEQRCTWTDLTVLLDREAQSAYARIPCVRRDSANAIIWWLADPLYSVPGNERRAEHFARLTLLALRSALSRDERFRWDRRLGSDARINMIVRYGWPSVVRWLGFENDSSHTAWLGSAPRRSPANEPYTTYEYTKPRVHAFPSAKILGAPLRSENDDWELLEEQRKSDPTFLDMMWWPREHFAPARPMVMLPAPQLAFLRRDTTIILATAIALDSETTQRAVGAPISDVSVIVTHDPNELQLVARGQGPAGTTSAQWGNIQPRPALVGIEIEGSVAGRWRNGISPPPALSAMKPGEIAISSPVLLYAPAAAAGLPSNPDSALSRMLGSARLSGVERIGIYWETYGIAPEDTVELAVWVERRTRQGIARRFTNSLRVTEDLNTPMSIRWEEVGAQNASVVPAAAAVVARSLALDVSRLASGAYSLDVAVRTRTGKVARARSEVTIR
jgi:hypothetical protein